MDWLPAIGAILVGYLAGSISFARIVMAAARPGEAVRPMDVEVSSGERFTMDSVSATTVRLQAGARYGCLTAILDMAKVAVPTLAVRLWVPDQPYYLIVAAAGVVGHDWPLLGRYRGGRGESPMIGGLLVVDPLALIGSSIIGSLVGFVVGSVLVIRWAWMLLLIPWLWLATGDPWHLAYIVVVVAAYFIALLPELRQYASMLRRRTDPTNEEIALAFSMGAGLGRAVDRFGLIPRLRRRMGRDRGDGGS